MKRLISLVICFSLLGLNTAYAGDPGYCNTAPYLYPAVGESYRPQNNGDVIRSLGYSKIDTTKWIAMNTDGYWEEAKEYYTKATLKLEPTNKSDKYAVMVLINGKHVGYVPRAYSKQLTAIIKKGGTNNVVIPSCIGYDPQYTDSIYNSYFSVSLNMDPYLKKMKARIPNWQGDNSLPMG